MSMNLVTYRVRTEFQIEHDFSILKIWDILIRNKKLEGVFDSKLIITIDMLEICPGGNNKVILFIFLCL
jgi:hypothetical protein